MNRLQSFAQIACALAWKSRRRNSSIESLDVVSVIIIADRQMAKLHQQFSGIGGTTDVLTFHHGEIVIGAQTAARQAHEFHSTTQNELRLYLVHGLLHLCGFDDHTAQQRKIMNRVQNKIFRHGLAWENGADGV